ncbi:methylmalonyl-CoA mutase [Gordonia sp. HNM0687]|uniref:methylmalonyl-CoA mutase n=1 Tax=Gordonia mangrovi TaxID=2665643 RepID=A0A6L7GRZ7_9ACTN|nr:methylmalonyl-CoA mutase family protein [Gordonia mangrovi]MXP22177.1 methylmalonyl-CoA mutase [Gordonia mangrovi]UVF77915.1 methylmalonyl-CoA mutase family protein [Gordonia mangrovi]
MSQTTASTSDRPDRPLDEVYQSWSEAAAAVVAKSRRSTVEELPATAEELLSTDTIDGLRIRPLYTRKDETAEAGLPGGFPFVRGADPDRDVTLGWRVTERFGDDDTPAAEVNQQILEALENGTSGLWLRIGGALNADDLATVLDGVYLDLIPVTLDAGADGLAAARALLAQRARAVAAPQAAAPTAATVTSLGLSPLTAGFSGRPDVDTADATALAAEVGAGVRTFRVDGTDFATAGADNGLELALVVAAAVTHLRDLTAAGMSASDALGQITFAVSAGDDQFATIAKFRALRKIWSRIADVVGAPDAGAALTHGVTDLSMQTQRDPWVNMLRTTIAAFGAGVGGADQVTVLGFDAAIPADRRTSSATFSRRIARNTQLLLLEESSIGRVLDPAGGSWFVESLTDEMAANAWAVFGEIETAGGYRSVLESGWIGDRVGASLARRDDSVAHRTIAVTGVNEFPNLDEKPLGAPSADAADVPLGTPRLARVGRVFEELRDRSDAVLAETGARPAVLLLPLGSVAEHNARTTFVANLLAAGGISAINPGPLTADGIADVVREHRTPIAVLCASKQRYTDDGAAALAAARATDLSSVLMAGPDKEWPDGDRPDGALRIGIDAVATLRGLLDQLTHASAGATS